MLSFGAGMSWRMRQKRPSSAHRPVTPAWKRRVVSELLERGMTRKDLADRVNATGAAITVLLRPVTKSSRLVDAVSLELEIPTPDFDDDRDAEVVADLRLLRQLNPSEYDLRAAQIRKAKEAEIRKRDGKKPS